MARRHHRSTAGNLALASVLGTLLVLSGCNSTRLIDSRPAPPEIELDGSLLKWEGGIISIDREHLSMGVMNDADALYLMVRTDDEAVLQKIMRGGLIVWVDSEGGKSRSFGIRYPVARSPGPMRASTEPYAWMRPAPPAPADDRVRRDHIPSGLEDGSEDVEIIRNGNRTRIPLQAAKGLDARISEQDGDLVYELRLPIAGKPYGLDFESGQVLGIGLETVSPNRQARRRSGVSILPPGGVMAPGPGGVIRPGGMRPVGPPGGERFITTQPLEVWTKVRLYDPK